MNQTPRALKNKQETKKHNKVGKRKKSIHEL